MKKNPLVIYHANCNDGFGAAYAAWRALRDFAEYLPMQYGDPVPDVAGRNVFIFDFSFSPEQMNEIYEASSTLVWRDHHKTAIEALPQIGVGTCLVASGYGHRIVVGRRGARLEVTFIGERLRHQRGAEDLAIAFDQAAIGGVLE